MSQLLVHGHDVWCYMGGLQWWSLLVSVFDCLSTKSGVSLENGLNKKRTLKSSPLLPLFEKCPLEEGAPVLLIGQCGVQSMSSPAPAQPRSTDNTHLNSCLCLKNVTSVLPQLSRSYPWRHQLSAGKEMIMVWMWDLLTCILHCAPQPPGESGTLAPGRWWSPGPGTRWQAERTGRGHRIVPPNYSTNNGESSHSSHTML